jgi:hypothetical protein
VKGPERSFLGGASDPPRKRLATKGPRMPRLASQPTAPAASAERPGVAKDGVKVLLTKKRQRFVRPPAIPTKSGVFSFFTVLPTARKVC